MANNEQLDNEFHDLLQQIENVMENLNYREKFVITTWLTKLKKSNASIEERKLRNRFLKHFLKNPEEVFQTEPFRSIPKEFCEPLVSLKKLLPKNSDEEASESGGRSYIEELFKSLPDQGRFLADQPVPKDGSFNIQVMKRSDQQPLASPKSFNI